MKGILKLQALYSILGRLSKREKAVLNAAVIFVSLALLDYLIVAPISTKMEKLNKEIQDKTASIKSNARMLSQKDKIISESAKYESYAIGSKTEVEEITSLLREIENLANKSSVYLIDMKPGGVKDMGSSIKYLVNVNCEAEMEQLTAFMYDIESSNNLLAIDKYQINPKTKELSVAKCSMTISKIVIP